MESRAVLHRRYARGRLRRRWAAGSVDDALERERRSNGDSLPFVPQRLHRSAARRDVFTTRGV